MLWLQNNTVSHNKRFFDSQKGLTCLILWPGIPDTHAPMTIYNLLTLYFEVKLCPTLCPFFFSCSDLILSPNFQKQCSVPTSQILNEYFFPSPALLARVLVNIHQTSSLSSQSAILIQICCHQQLHSSSFDSQHCKYPWLDKGILNNVLKAFAQPQFSLTLLNACIYRVFWDMPNLLMSLQWRNKCTGELSLPVLIFRA